MQQRIKLDAFFLRYLFIDTEKKEYTIALLCKVMRVSRSGYYSWQERDKSPRQIENENLIPIVEKAHKGSKGTYGTRRIAEEIEAHGNLAPSSCPWLDFSFRSGEPVLQ